MNDQKSSAATQQGQRAPGQQPPSQTPQKNPASGGDQNTAQRSPNQQKPPTDNERKSGSEQSEKAHRSNLAGDQDTDEPVETEEGRSANRPA